jgi:hypothetical protein
MADPDKTSKKDEETTRQAERQAEAMRRPPDKVPAPEATTREASRVQAITEPTATAETEGVGRVGEGVQRVIGGAGRAAGATVSGIGGAASSAFQSAGNVGGSAIGATRDVLNNVISATEEVGSNLVGGVTHVAIDVVHGVGDVGESAVHTVTDLLAALVGGVKSVVSEALPGGGVATERAPTEEQVQYRRPAAERTTVEEALH